tara:strand:+ start:433 stop:687 length:255 start_codon:yes stop_codon:yes gene_type:complete
MQIYLRDLCRKNASTFNIIVDEKTTIEEFKLKVEEKIKIPEENQRYTFNAKQMPEDGNLKNFVGKEPFEHGWCTFNFYFRSVKL